MNNYQKHINQIANLNGRPTLLIHVCCGVCSVYPLLYLRKHFNITIYFSNSNIFPYEEYTKRLDALNQYLDILKDPNIKLVVSDYNYKGFNALISQYKNEKEGGKRCKLCYFLRLKDTFAYAKENHYDYVTTVMSISNRKNAEWINEIGEKLEAEYKVKYLYADFKKGNGITENEKLNKKLGLYHQNYCGCEYSIR